MTRVLVADDSATVRARLAAILRADPDIEVVGEACNGLEAVSLTNRLRPHVVTMDVRMPVLDGYEATTRIMTECPTPIVIVTSAVNGRDQEVSIRALGAGAVSIRPLPATAERDERELRQAVREMAEIKVVRHWPRRRAAGPEAAPTPTLVAPRRLLAMTLSTGGPAVLRDILAAVPPAFDLPLLVVQHIAPGYVEGLARWLDTLTPLTVKLAEPGERVRPATVYLAPDDYHLCVSTAGTIALADAPAERGFRPSGTLLFESVAASYGSAAAAAIMTGMGTDGVAGLRAVRRAGGLVLAQEEAGSVVFGMARAAIDAGLVDAVLAPTAILRHVTAQATTRVG